jgi:ribonucleoside-triphosphate reductase
VTGYLRPVENYNAGKKEEYYIRKKFKMPEETSACVLPGC